MTFEEESEESDDDDEQGDEAESSPFDEVSVEARSKAREDLGVRVSGAKVIDLALKLINPVIEPGEVFPNVNGIHLVIAGELCDHHVVGVESTLHHSLALEDLLLHCFEPRLHASGLLRPFNITDVQHPLAHLDRLMGVSALP
ncbi:DNA-directed RNA polymerase subunit beta [Hordeum vulgare]|nr:DNA-directed RNA polymerase subunit beta [Hordeum vulgare]